MKKLLTLLLALILSSTITAQEEDTNEDFAIAAFFDPHATKDGFNIGYSIEYQDKYLYVKMQTFIFPDLNGTDYAEISGVPLGLNYKFETVRVYSGVKLGFVLREGLHPLAGFEGGIDFNITKTIFIGLIATHETREDLKIYGKNADTSMCSSGFIRLGFKF